MEKLRTKSEKNLCIVRNVKNEDEYLGIAGFHAQFELSISVSKTRKQEIK